MSSSFPRSHTRSRSLALEDGRSLVKKRLDALFEVVAPKCGSPHRLDRFELVSAHRGTRREAAQLGFDNCHREGRSAGDRTGDSHRRFLELLRFHQAIEQAEPVGIFGGEGIARENHLFDDVQGQDPQEVGHTLGVVGDSDLDWRDGERRFRCADGKVASDGQVSGRAPDAAVKHCDDRHRAVPDALENLYEPRGPVHGVLAVERYLVDVVTG